MEYEMTNRPEGKHYLSRIRGNVLYFCRIANERDRVEFEMQVQKWQNRPIS